MAPLLVWNTSGWTWNENEFKELHSGKFDSWVIRHLAITVTQIGAKSEISFFFKKNLLVTNYKVPNVFSTKGCEFFFLNIHFKSMLQQKMTILR